MKDGYMHWAALHGTLIFGDQCMKSIVYWIRAWLVALSLFTLSACGLDDPPNTAPVISGAPATAATEDSAYADASISATDEDDDSISFSISGPTWLSIDSVTGVLDGIPLNEHVGANSFTITATDSNNGTDTLVLSITVANTNDIPVFISLVPDQAVTFDFTYDLDLSAYFSDPDVSDTPIYSVTSNSDITTVSTSVAGSVLTLSQVGFNLQVVSITVRITDGGSAAFAEDTFNITIDSPALYSNGANWNDYIKNNGVDRYSASDTVCDGSETGGYDACIHGGEVLAFDTGLTDACGSLTAADALGAFDWACDDSGATTVFYSSGLADGMNLSDLIDFTAGPIVWKDNQLVVTGGAGYTSTAMPWWLNSIVEDNNGMIGGDAVAGTIYVVTADPQDTYVIDQSNVGLVIKPGVTMTGTVATSEILISADTQNFLWLEGTLDATGDASAIELSTIKFSVLSGITAATTTGIGVHLVSSTNNNLLRVNASNSGVGIFLRFSDYNTLSELDADNGDNGVFLFQSNYNTLSRVNVGDNSFRGIFINTSSSNNVLSEVDANNNGLYGISVAFSSDSNIFSEVTANNNADGIFIDQSSGQTLSGVTANNNSSAGVTLQGSSNNTLSRVAAINNNTSGISMGPFNTETSSNNILSGVTVASNGQQGIEVLTSCSNNIMSGVTATNNNGFGVSLGTSSSNTLSGLTAANNVMGVVMGFSSNNILSGMTATNNNIFGIRLFGGTGNVFSGPLKVGNNATGDCYVAAESGSEGLMDDAGGVDLTHDGLCLEADASDFGTATTGVSLASSFVGKVTADDTVNPDDTNGTASYPADPTVFDWGNFDNIYRAWGLDGSAFANTDHMGQWTTGTGRIWDWSLKSTDTVIRNAFVAPTGDDTFTHTWSDTSTTTFLRNAVEISDDGVGNDNLLCESNEECLYMPNMASYQGHGALISAGAFTDGTITGVTLWKYTTNGY
jgi:parallel beta-helix repeat protein